jgi:hypothetical protein
MLGRVARPQPLGCPIRTRHLADGWGRGCPPPPRTTSSDLPLKFPPHPRHPPPPTCISLSERGLETPSHLAPQIGEHHGSRNHRLDHHRAGGPPTKNLRVAGGPTTNNVRVTGGPTKTVRVPHPYAALCGRAGKRVPAPPRTTSSDLPLKFPSHPRHPQPPTCISLSERGLETPSHLAPQIGEHHGAGGPPICSGGPFMRVLCAWVGMQDANSGHPPLSGPLVSDSGDKPS